MPETVRTVLAVYLAAINITAAVAACADKRRAIRGRWRIPERTLLLLGFFGGAAGELLAMLLIRHKTKHAKFMVLLPLFCLLHAALLIWLALTLA
ncbi:DUF1294 domain-containing protein [Anaeromassilibacillus senegalensis]|uniref:DUF1294 domain-containing protein n=1 Tax=Anaeromassilibacillus senegalensis TaxID=1673717 RepID=A0ABS9CLV7_9FIRM|nr:DUF1294 domain-containing protein [Anaeromassilibacillus senegalensis]MCF2651775.1 DUF1294 domain-containing protein [Anaeromassilibacillus senegalensis]MCI5651412.1 DUF1294 domain-containing protein [Ruminococcus bromii]